MTHYPIEFDVNSVLTIQLIDKRVNTDWTWYNYQPPTCILFGMLTWSKEEPPGFYKYEYGKQSYATKEDLLTRGYFVSDQSIVYYSPKVSITLVNKTEIRLGFKNINEAIEYIEKIKFLSHKTYVPISKEML